MENKSIFVTGAASGIGRETVKLFHERGWFVGCYDVDKDALRELGRELGGSFLSVYLDVRDKHAFDAAMAEYSERTRGRLDLMFNNAGIAIGGNFDDLPFEKAMDIVNINFIGVLNGIHAAIPLLRNTENALCLTTSSASAIFGAPGMAVYSATKFAVKGLTEALSVELARHGARAADVLPGTIETSLWRADRYVDGKAVSTFENVPEKNKERKDASRTIAPAKVAEVVWEAYHGDKVHWYVPPDLEDREKFMLGARESVRDRLIAERSQSESADK